MKINKWDIGVSNREVEDILKRWVVLLLLNLIIGKNVEFGVRVFGFK